MTPLRRHGTAGGTAASRIGGLVGLSDLGVVQNCYFCDAAHDNGIGLPETAGPTAFYVRTHPVYTAESPVWDFSTPIWAGADGSVYPYLTWEQVERRRDAPHRAAAACDAVFEQLFGTVAE